MMMAISDSAVAQARAVLAEIDEDRVARLAWGLNAFALEREGAVWEKAVWIVVEVMEMEINHLTQAGMSEASAVGLRDRLVAALRAQAEQARPA